MHKLGPGFSDWVHYVKLGWNDSKAKLGILNHDKAAENREVF